VPGKEAALVKRIIVISTLAASMAVMFALAGSASAAKPEFETFQVEETEFIANCGTFEVRTDYVLEGRVTTYFDSEGNEDYERWHLQFHDFFYNSETGEGFVETNTTVVLVDPASGTEVSGTGLSYHVTVPGEGVVLLDAGRLERDEAGEIVFVAGPHQVHLGEDTDKLCKALA
jgi:hypothetical protein